MSVTKGNHVRFVDEHMENYDQEVSYQSFHSISQLTLDFFKF